MGSLNWVHFIRRSIRCLHTTWWWGGWWWWWWWWWGGGGGGGGGGGVTFDDDVDDNDDVFNYFLSVSSAAEPQQVENICNEKWQLLGVYLFLIKTKRKLPKKKNICQLASMFVCVAIVKCYEITRSWLITDKNIQFFENIWLKKYKFTLF